MRRLAPIFVAVSLLLGAVYFAQAPPSGPPVIALTPDAAALREAFNRDYGYTRLVLLVDPT